METQFSGDLIVVRRHLPLESNFANTREAAQFAEAAANQGEFIEFSDLLYTRQSEWSQVADPTPIFESYAAEVGLNRNDLAEDLLDPAINAGITADAEGALELGITSTPTFVLEGETQSGLASFDELGTRIQAEIDALDEVFRLNRETGELSIADTDLFADANFPLTVPIVVRDADGNEEVIEAVIQREEI